MESSSPPSDTKRKPHITWGFLRLRAVFAAGRHAAGWGYSGEVNENLPPCPKCSCAYTYEMNALVVCPECGHEWVPAEGAADGGQDGEGSGERVVKDSVGNVLRDGDTVTVAKALKVKGSPSGIKAGTKVRNIRLIDGVDGHDIDCKIDGFGAMQLKSSVVKKA